MLQTADAIAGFDREQELRAYSDMLAIRRFEEKAGQLYGMGFIGGFCHLAIGQEAVVVGLQMAIRPGDQVITAYRGHGQMLACGADPKAVMAELTGRRSGSSRGKGGSMHLFSKDHGFYGGHGIVGANVPLGAGLALANRYRGTSHVTLTYLGDGAANQGQVYETFNMAKRWSLPVVFVIENNQPEDVARGRSSGERAGERAGEQAGAPADLCQRGAAFEIPGERVDGMDVRAVKAAGTRAVALARDGHGPTILEMLTERYRGHAISDPTKHRPSEGRDHARETRDPIALVRRRLIDGGMATEDDLKDIDARIREAVNAAAAFAQQEPEPDAGALWTDVVLAG